MSTFCQRLYHRKCQRRGVGGQKSQNLVNVVCERPLPLFININTIETVKAGWVGGHKNTTFCQRNLSATH